MKTLQSAVAKISEDEETIRCCAHCFGEIRVVSAGDESWDYCEDCQQVEGDTVEMTLEEYEAAHG